MREFRHGRCGPTRPCWMPRFYPYNRCLRPPLIGPRTKLNQSHVAERRPGAILYRMGFICSDPRLPLAADFHRPHWLSHWRCNCKRRPQSLSSITFEAFAFLLPANFQYFGPWAVLSIALQFYFGVRLLRIFFGRRLWPSLCGGLLLTISPSPAYRLAGHFALANHWLILAAFCLYFSWQRGAIKSVELNNRGAELESRGAGKAHSKSRAAARLQMQHVGIQVNLAVARLKLGNWARHRYRRAEDHVHAGGVGEVRLSQHHRARPQHPPRSRHDRNR